MSRSLDVYLRENLVGHLIQNDHGQMEFEYNDAWLTNPVAMPLSNSLPLSQKHFDRNECRGFFSGILPEEGPRTIIAKNLGISAKNDFAMLEKIGGECAGAVTFLPAGQPLPKQEGNYRPLPEKELAEILRALPRRPLLAGEDGIRLSLAGAQDKIAMRVHDGQFFIPLAGTPSTHIIKPAIKHFAGTVFNEAFCMKLAQSLGCRTAKVSIGKVEEIDYLLVERYDRTLLKPAPGQPEILKREHQEDFCQALGIVPENKYQNEGGPSLKQCFDLVRATASSPIFDLEALLEIITFNFLIGNNDAHGKNFSLLYTGEGAAKQVQLSPFYDLLCTAYYPDLTKKMAMKIGGEYVSDKVFPKHFEQQVKEAGFAKSVVDGYVSELAGLILTGIKRVRQEHAAFDPFADFIQKRCETIIKRFAVS